ncbi:hypothetical protein Leryth_004402 [Lithospermum erythrorhizon]|nr:hypothetical protein Leryth_004402 [Lithospermum erythrorhizon]
MLSGSGVRKTDLYLFKDKLSDSAEDSPFTPASNQDPTYASGGSSSKVTASPRNSDSAELRSGGPFGLEGT